MVGIPTSAGQTYYIVAFSDAQVNGGNLVARFSAAPPSPEAAITLDKTGVSFEDGDARISVSYSCTNTDVERRHRAGHREASPGDVRWQFDGSTMERRGSY